MTDAHNITNAQILLMYDRAPVPEVAHACDRALHAPDPAVRMRYRGVCALMWRLAYGKIEDALIASSSDNAPRAGWQDRVLAAVRDVDNNKSKDRS